MTPDHLTAADLQTSLGRRIRSQTVRWLFMGAAAVTVLVSALIIWTVASGAWTFISQVEFTRLTDIGWFPRRGLFDLTTLLVNSAQISVIAMAVAVPSGFGAAFYLSEYAHPRVRRVMKPTLELLASVPSVVLGVFAISFITPSILTNFFSEINFFNKLAAGIAVGLLVIPLIASISEDALRAVPQALREASAGLGARRVTTSIRVVLPAAMSGLMAATIVGFSRAIGETMVVTIASGGGDTSLYNLSLFESGGTLTSAMAALGLGTDQVAGNNLAFQSLFFLGALLFAMTLVLNMVGDVIVRRLQNRY
ncbi:MAG: phosphate ABC transporter permease subunit PstC [Acidimicrobiaceae bacterium]|uniref:phosphate ABC transporter permease subunit PstC n=1 Tax=Candidatus Poriferisodalis multihospitum TaxID=2983191 RepID=UPI00137F187C|nr:phosphate ABC transporter permease subunit PstC [Candidatus Poriferisodalis multihospitum]MCY3585898.1 phosphate ABC transporter permease subunit PstC [Acidimicrobiaceae bacterium]MXV88812.1 phosphate ABC transporter permease subunit PstC [Acidimicrobiales bacterium]MCY3893199.1 phosphate ABC transporter permease subunit PstC [Acidimicrobiaceae bacterium]MCY3950554.1 phosphate ABC transporter permease subunit PstC [Acidimicrobiaceae bacterium]MDE0676610.1 phosphate ABC transporter permease 